MSTKIQVTPDDVKNIAVKLDQFGEVLSSHEREILLAIFGLAATKLKELAAAAPPPAPAPHLPPLSAGFNDAFKPGTNTIFTIDDGDSEAAPVKIKGEIGVETEIAVFIQPKLEESDGRLTP